MLEDLIRKELNMTEQGSKKMSLLVSNHTVELLDEVGQFLADTGDPSDNVGRSAAMRWLVELGSRVFLSHRANECENELRGAPAEDESVLLVPFNQIVMEALRDEVKELRQALATHGDARGAVKVSVVEAVNVAVDNGLTALGLMPRGVDDEGAV